MESFLHQPTHLYNSRNGTRSEIDAGIRLEAGKNFHSLESFELSSRKGVTLVNNYKRPGTDFQCRLSEHEKK